MINVQGVGVLVDFAGAKPVFDIALRYGQTQFRGRIWSGAAVIEGAYPKTFSSVRALAKIYYLFSVYVSNILFTFMGL